MGAVADRMRDDLRLRNYCGGTIAKYLEYAWAFVAHFMRPPETITRDEIRSYLLYLLDERKLAPATYRGRRAAIKFLYEVTLGLPRRVERILAPKVARKLPDVLGRQEVLSLLGAVECFKCRVISPAPRHEHSGAVNGYPVATSGPRARQASTSASRPGIPGTHLAP